MNDDVQTELLREAVRWLRFQSIEKAKAAVAALLDSDQKKLAFDMTNGSNTARGIGATIGVSHGTVVNWWGAWFSAGILFEHEGTYKKLFSLSDLGIAAPANPAPKRNSASIVTQSTKRAQQ